MPTLFLVGAGCSLGTLHNRESIRPPTAAEFVNQLDKRGWINDYPELKKVIEHARKAHRHVGLEELWTTIDLHAKFVSPFPIAWTARGIVIRELKSAVVRMYGSLCDEISRSISETDNCTLVKVVASEIKAGDTLISFNYDTIVERLVSRMAKAPLQHGKELKPGTIRFAKPHGSTSWCIKDLPHAVTDGNPLMESFSHEAIRDEIHDPLILGAVPLKSELVYEVQEYYRSPRVFEVIREQWRTLANAVAIATRIVILGYSFPKEDMYGRFFINEGQTARSTGLPLSIDVFNLDLGTVRQVAEIFPNGTPITFNGPVTPATFNGA